MGSSKFDELLVKLKTGKWNILYFVTGSVWFSLIPFQSLSGTYVAPAMDYECVPPDGLNVTIAENSCSYIISNSTNNVSYPCTQWNYDTSVFTSTLTNEFDLVCDREYLRATYQSIKMLGTFVSPIIGGYLADKYGRKIVSTVLLAVFTLMGVGMPFLNNITMILVARFILGFVNLPTFYIWMMEVCEIKIRGLVGILTALPWAFGTMAWGGIAYLIRDWRYLQLTVSLPNLLIFPAIYFMDESPRWLITKGKHDEAIKVLRKAARWNHATLPPEEELRALMKNIQDEAECMEKKSKDVTTSKSISARLRETFLTRPTLCSTRSITLITVIMSIDYFMVATVFYGLSLNGTNFSADPFMYMVLTGLMEMPAYSITAPVIQKFGRKKTTVFGYVVSGISILALVFIPKDITWLVMTLAMLGKMLISAAYQTVYVYVNELFPTVVRSKGMGSAIVSSRLGSMFSPFITDYIGPYVYWMPSVIFGGMSLLAGFATMLLPETLGRPLPDTISDLDEKRIPKGKIDVEGEPEEKQQLNS